jgi:hypothetical protein
MSAAIMNIRKHEQHGIEEGCGKRFVVYRSKIAMS